MLKHLVIVNGVCPPGSVASTDNRCYCTNCNFTTGKCAVSFAFAALQYYRIKIQNDDDVNNRIAHQKQTQ